jgi:hypothetical protein
MNDKELVKLAAKAAGIKVHGLADKYVAQHSYGPHGLCIENDKGGDSLWNPLEDDGDALRLAVKLGMMLDVEGEYKSYISAQAKDGTYTHYEDNYTDPYAATRRAITRAAAEIGLLKTPNVKLTGGREDGC